MVLKKIVLYCFLLLSGIRLIPHILITGLHPSRTVIWKDLERYRKRIQRRHPGLAKYKITALVYLLTFRTEVRSILCYRLGWTGKALSPLCSPISTLFINTTDVGPGLFIQHGFSTIINAKKIGSNCKIYQQVTIGHRRGGGVPTLGDNVKVGAGAKILGRITVGNNCKVGANAVVIKDVPPNCTVVGVPARIVRRDGKKISEPA